MTSEHFEFWPKGLPKSLTVPKTTIYDNLEVTARRYPDKAAIHYYGNEISYDQLYKDVNALAGYLQNVQSVAKGDRVILYMQNSPQFVIAFYAILRANAVVVPINPMNVTAELKFYIEDTGAKLAIVGQELYEQIEPNVKTTPLEHLIVAAYSDNAGGFPEGRIPHEVMKERQVYAESFVTSWMEALSAQLKPGPILSESDDLAVMPYTSGTTGKPKGCMHTNRTAQANIAGTFSWSPVTPNGAVLAALPFFHVTGMQHLMNMPIYSGAAMVIMTRWDRDAAGEFIQNYKCTHWVNIATMVVDFISNPNLSKYNLESLTTITGGGATLPEAIGTKLYELTGVKFAEGYGLSETISQTHTNPKDRPKLQCMGIPFFDVDSRIIDPNTLEEKGPNEEGEVIVNGPQVFVGYWNRPEDTKNAFITIEGKTFLRTGDIAKYDEEGYYFMVDRVKRMVNASGFNVWPSEVESVLYKHPAVQQACVIGVPHERRGETVKAFIVLNEDSRGQVDANDIIEWSKKQMAAYKYPRIIEFVEKLPTSGSGKILWRVLQDREKNKVK